MHAKVLPVLCVKAVCFDNYTAWSLFFHPILKPNVVANASWVVFLLEVIAENSDVPVTAAGL